MAGWIKLHRSLLDWEWFGDANVLKVWIWLLLEANSEDRRWQGRVIKRGQKLTSWRRMSNALGISQPTLGRALKKLVSTGEITLSEISKETGTLITINNYDAYQEGANDSAKNILAPPLAPPLAKQELREEYSAASPACVRACESDTASVIRANIESLRQRGQFSLIYLRSHMTPEEVDANLPEFVAQMALDGCVETDGRLANHIANWMQIKRDKLNRQANGVSKQQQESERKATIAASLASDLQYLSAISGDAPKAHTG